MPLERYQVTPIPGYSVATFRELQPMLIGPDKACCCTTQDKCVDVDKRDGKRCTLHHLQVLDRVAMNRRGWSGTH